MVDLSALSPMLRHALESFEHGILHYLDATELGRKFALLHLDHSIELVLKEKIASTGRSIYRKDGRTISVHEAYGALSNTSIPERPRLEDLHDFRNIIQHKGLTPDEHTTEFHVTQAYKFIKRFLKDELGVDLSAYLPHSLVVAMEGLEAGHEELTEEAKRLLGAAERAFSSGDYATAVFSGFTALEITARDRGGMTKDGIPFPLSLLDLMDSYATTGVIDDAVHKKFAYVRRLRNMAAHTGAAISRDRAREALDYSSQIIDALPRETGKDT